MGVDFSARQIAWTLGMTASHDFLVIGDDPYDRRCPLCKRLEPAGTPVGSTSVAWHFKHCAYRMAVEWIQGGDPEASLDAEFEVARMELLGRRLSALEGPNAASSKT